MRNDSCHSIQSRAAVKPHGVKQTQLMSRETRQGSVETLVSLYLQPCWRPISWVYVQGGEEAADQSPACWEGIYGERRYASVFQNEWFIQEVIQKKNPTHQTFKRPVLRQTSQLDVESQLDLISSFCRHENIMEWWLKGKLTE